MRREYDSKPLFKESLSENPGEQFKLWLDEAYASNIIEPNAMTLSTASKDGIPTSRIVLLKKFTKEGITFFSNYSSRKAKQLYENPVASVTFYWKELNRQVSIQGKVKKVSKEESIEYFATRPRNTQLGTWASKQGETVESRLIIDERFEEMKKQFEKRDIPCPEFWGGFRLEPNFYLFWQGRENRLHDYFRYQLVKEKWHLDRIMP